MKMLPIIKNENEWESKFLEAIKDIHGNCTYQESAEMLRKLQKTGLLRFTDLQNNPARFFKAHRLLLAPNRISEASGFGVRFTVQFNLFAGSILGLGNEKQVALLDQFQEQGVLGCFNLTEVFAGVNSGLVVETTATWNIERQQFLIESPSGGSKKNWISQGLTASHTVLIANLKVGDKFYGPHGFLIEMRDANGELLNGITIEDMGKKTVANDLDNARVGFQGVWVNQSCLLSRFAEIRDNKYHQTTKERMRIEIIGQRLLTGRLAIAEAACIFGLRLCEMTKTFANQKVCWAPPGTPKPKLSEIPHIKAIFDEAEVKLNVLQRYNEAVEKKLSKVLMDRSIPNQELVELIAVAKIKCVQTSITLLDKLAREVGSYALMHSSGFGATHWLLMCQFAEGDSRILMQKLARDRMKSFQMISSTDMVKTVLLGTAAESKEMKTCIQLSRALSSASSKDEAGKLWNDNWQTVYDLAEAVCEKYVEKTVDANAAQALFAKL